MAAELSRNARLDIEAALDRVEYGTIVLKIVRHEIVHIDFTESRQYGRQKGDASSPVEIPKRFVEPLK